MTSGADGLRILGPLEARFGGDTVALGGAKQRAALALLLLHADEVVALDRLVDELWDESPPPSAAHTVEAYVSRLRQLLDGAGIQLLRRGAGYVLLLGDVVLDARFFERLHAAASEAAASGDDERAAALAGEALALWRGDVLADVPLGRWTRVEAEGLAERRLLLAEQRSEALLRLGRHEDVAGELQPLVRLHPYRERLLAQLMVALYRSGRSADALAEYEQTRSRLADDLGLQPSDELRQLSGRIVRHDPSLLRVSAAMASAAPQLPVRRRFALAAAIAVVLALVASGSVRQTADAAPAQRGLHVALVLPRASAYIPEDEIAVYETRLREYLAFTPELTTQTLVAADAARTTATIARGRFDVVLWVGDARIARSFAPRVDDLGRTRFVFLAASLDRLGLRGVPNATAVRFAEEEANELVGYMSGLVDTRRSGTPADVVSVIAYGSTRAALRGVDGFRRGVQRAHPGVEVLVDFVPEGAGLHLCERLANAQIDRGSDVVFVAAGRCGAGAATVAQMRDVWAVDGDRSVGDGPHLLVETYVEHHRAVDAALAGFKRGTLPAGGELVLGLADDYAVGIGEQSPLVPAAISSAVVRLCSSIREATASS